MLDLDGLEGVTPKQILDDPSMIIPALTEWDNLKAEGNWLLRSAFDATGGNDVYQTITGRDFDNWTKN